MRIDTAEDIGLVVREHRRKLGLSQQRLAELAGVGRQWVVAVESGKASAELGLVLRLLKALGLNVFVDPREAAAEPESAIDLDRIIARARAPR